MQSSHGLNVLVTWMPRALAVVKVMVLEGFLSSTWRLLIFFLSRAMANNALSFLASQTKLTMATHYLWLYCHLKYWPLCCCRGHLQSCFPARVHKCKKTFSHLPCGKTSHDIEYGLVQSHQLGIPCLVACFFHSKHNTGASLDGLMGVVDVKQASIIIGDMARCSWVSNPGILCEWINSVTINGTHHTSPQGLFHILNEPNFLFYIFFLFSVVSEHKTMSSSSPSIAFSAFSNFFNCHIFAPDSPHMPFSAAVVAYPIKFYVLIVIFFCFLVFFFFFIFICRTSIIPRFVAILITLYSPLLVLLIVCP